MVKPLSSLKRMMLIINPVSGRRTSLRYLPDIIRIFNENSYAVTVFPTGRKGDAVEFMRMYSKEYDTVVCIGGDGTLNETITGLLSADSFTPIGYIPSGSTNDFAACHGIPSDMLEAARNIAEGRTRIIDIGRFGSEYFTYVAAFGMFSWLSYTTPQNMKNVLGHSAYIIDAVKDLPKIKPQHLKLKVDGAEYEGDYIFGAVCNSTSVAGTISLPKNVVDTSDGKFEVLLVHEPRTIIDFQNLLSGVFSHNYSSPFLDFFQADSLDIECAADLEWSLDGERGGCTSKINVQNLNNRLTLLG